MLLDKKLLKVVGLERIPPDEVFMKPELLKKRKQACSKHVSC
jgi:hypothetical protein